MSARTQETPLEPAELTYGRLEADMLQGWFDEDGDDVDTAVIPRLQVSQTVLVPVALPESIPPFAGAPSSRVAPRSAPAPATSSPAASATPSTTPAEQPTTSTRHRHASAQSLAAVRRNQVALATVVVGTVLLGSLVGLAAGWVGLAGYALLVGTLLVVQRRVNARYAPRHSRYAPRHA
jgi:hypothetical protein